MDNAQRRVLGLVAVASWLLIDAVRASGPLLSDLFSTSAPFAVAAALAAFAAGSVVAWLAALAGRHFGHGAVVMFMLAVVAIARLGMPLLHEGWVVTAGLYLTALTLATIVLTARVALGNGGSAPLLAGTTFGAAAAVAEQTILRTWDAVWRADAMGWIALAAVAVLALANGWRTLRLEPVASSRGWWAYGLYWSLLVSAFANVAWINAQTGLRMSGSALLAIVSLCTGALLAAQSRSTSRVVLTVLGVAGVGALSVLMLRPGLAAAIALPIAVAVTALAAAQVMRPAHSTPARRLGAATVFGLVIVMPVLFIQVGERAALPLPHPLVLVLVGTATIVGALWRAWMPPLAAPPQPASAGSTPSPEAEATARWISPGVPLRAAVGVAGAVALSVWTANTYESPRTLSEDFLPAPQSMSWNVHYGVQPGVTGGPAVRLDEIAATVRSSSVDVTMLQEVNRGGILGGGTDMLEYLAGELRLPYVYAGSNQPQLGNAIFTSREHANPRSLELPAGDASGGGSAVAVDFMGATFTSAHLQARDTSESRQEQAQALADWLDEPQPIVIGADLGSEPDSAVLLFLADAGFVSAQAVAGVPGATYLGTDPTGAGVLTRDYLLGRGVEFTSFETLGVPWSDHLPLLARATTGATAPTEAGEDVNEAQPEAGTSPSPSPSPSASASASASASPSPTEE